MCHDATESSQRMAIIVVLTLFENIHNPVVAPFVVVRDPAVVGPVGDEGVLLPVIVVVWTVW